MTTFDCADPLARRSGLTAAAQAAHRGDLVVLPTDTVYGIGADAFNTAAVQKLLTTKGRGPDMPVPVLIGSWATLDGLVTAVTPAMRRLMEAFWPGELSLVVDHAPSLQWNLGDTRGSVMVRMPLHPVALDLLRTVGPMAVSSANRSGQPPATSVDQAQQLGDDIAVYLDGGSSTLGVASTIVDLTGEMPRVLRQGALELDRIRDVAGEVLAVDQA